MTPVVDLALVLYRPRWEIFEQELIVLCNVIPEFRGLRILLSGDASDMYRLRTILSKYPAIPATVTNRYDNLGFAGGQDHLLDDAFQADATHVIVFNPDVFISPGSLRSFIASSYSHASAQDRPSLYGPTLRRPGGHQIDSAGIIWTRDGRHLDSTVEPSETYTNTTGLTGACLLVGRDVYQYIKSIDGYFFDPAFVAYREDADLAARCLSYGVGMVLIDTPGFTHDRGLPSKSRANGFINQLSVQNRFLMRWKLGRHRPGKIVPSSFRDLLVAMASLTVERGSLPGLTRALRMRRNARYGSPTRAMKRERGIIGGSKDEVLCLNS